MKKFFFLREISKIFCFYRKLSKKFCVYGKFPKHFFYRKFTKNVFITKIFWKCFGFIENCPKIFILYKIVNKKYIFSTEKFWFFIKKIILQILYFSFYKKLKNSCFRIMSVFKYIFLEYFIENIFINVLFYNFFCTKFRKNGFL